jgi:hypothetical protein
MAKISLLNTLQIGLYWNKTELLEHTAPHIF